jgi:hypothetical protein
MRIIEDKRIILDLDPARFTFIYSPKQLSLL